MTNLGLQLLSYFFYVFHTALILFNLVGWMHRKTRRWNLITLLATFGSWVVLGIWKGWGYCFLTDWHYDILRQLGERDMPSNYIAFLTQKLTGWLPDAMLVNSLTLGLALLALAFSLWVNLKSSKK
ncbi:MAG: DUF2784 family protein [Pricia sp.]